MGWWMLKVERSPGKPHQAKSINKFKKKESQLQRLASIWMQFWRRTIAAPTFTFVELIVVMRQDIGNLYPKVYSIFAKGMIQLLEMGWEEYTKRGECLSILSWTRKNLNFDISFLELLYKDLVVQVDGMMSYSIIRYQQSFQKMSGAFTSCE